MHLRRIRPWRDRICTAIVRFLVESQLLAPPRLRVLEPAECDARVHVGWSERAAVDLRAAAEDAHRLVALARLAEDRAEVDERVSRLEVHGPERLLLHRQRRAQHLLRAHKVARIEECAADVGERARCFRVAVAEALAQQRVPTLKALARLGRLPLPAQHAAERRERAPNGDVLGAEALGVRLERAAVERLCVVEAAGRVDGGR
mmetsp:Transcript_335/g.960  ORF Transcript_335/g.960 Transcript_335/m.960 type:complete len:204 (+) Transcript_335:79-690(+)